MPKVSYLDTFYVLEPSSVATVQTIRGTSGYMDPDFYGKRLVNEKIEVYSLGVVLVEVLSE